MANSPQRARRRRQARDRRRAVTQALYAAAHPETAPLQVDAHELADMLHEALEEGRPARFEMGDWAYAVFEDEDDDEPIRVLWLGSKKCTDADEVFPRKVLALLHRLIDDTEE